MPTDLAPPETPTDPDGVVEVRIHLRDTLTGEDAWHVFQMDASRATDADDPEGWFWTDGNGACDCERMRCLAAALGRPDPNIPCGDARVVIVAATVDGEPREGWRDPVDEMKAH